MAKVTIDGKEIEVENGIPVIQACEMAGVEIPRFCYHDRLRIAGNCRMCLVEVEKSPKPVASCAMPVSDGMIIHTNSEKVRIAREGVMEFLLINHPLDCPICDKGGECDLQDQSFKYGKGTNSFHESKRAVKDKYMGPLIQTHMTRCIHCTRCIRFISDIAGVEELGAIGRGEEMQVTSYLDRALTSELSGNIIDICPVGALNSKPYAYTARKWELKSTDSIDVFDAMGCNIRVDARGLEVMRILPRVNEEINEEWISDKTRFSYDGLKRQRIDKPFVKIDGKLAPSNWDDALSFLSTKIKSLDMSKIGAIAGTMADTESMIVLKILLEKLGSKNIDFNQFDYKFDYSDRTNYLFNSGFAGLEKCDLLLIIGVDIRKHAPVLGGRIGKLVRFNNLKVARIGAQSDQTFSVIELGDSTASIQEIENNTHKFCLNLASAKNPMMIIGDGIYSRSDSLALLESLRKIATQYNIGFNILHNHASTVGAIDVGFIATDDKFTALKMAEKISTGEMELLFLLGADEVDIQRDHKGFVVYIGHHGDRGAQIADIVLPAAAFTEKDATYINNEGKMQRTNIAVLPVGKAIPDFEVIIKIAESLGIDLGFNNLHGVRKLINSESQKNRSMCKMKATKIFSSPIASVAVNFYHTNSISRASPTMANCVKEFAQKEDRP